MVIQGHVRNGVVVPEEQIPLPEGTRVMISYEAGRSPATGSRRIALPLVKSTGPENVLFAKEDIANLLDEEDVSP